MLEINRTLPLDKKIRVISISFGSDRRNFLKAIEDAGKEGVFVISSSLSQTHDLKFQGLGRECLSNPDDINSYLPGSWWSKMFYKNPDILKMILLYWYQWIQDALQVRVGKKVMFFIQMVVGVGAFHILLDFMH